MRFWSLRGSCGPSLTYIALLGKSRKDIPSKQRNQKKGTPSEAVEPMGIVWQAVPQLYFSLLSCAPGPDYGEREDTVTVPGAL